MEIYKQLLQKKNVGEKLDLEDLTKEDFYFMYIEEGMLKEQIAKLFNIKISVIEKIRNKWNIKITQEFISDEEIMNKLYKDFGNGYEFDYSLYILRKYMGVPKFDDLFVPILKILSDDKIHTIKEFWSLTNKNYEVSERELEFCVSKENPTLFYRANWCIDAMKRAKLLEELKVKEYKITKRGKNLLEECLDKNIEEIKLGFLLEKYEDYIKEYIIDNIENDDFDEEIIKIEDEETKQEKIEKQVAKLQEVNYEEIAPNIVSHKTKTQRKARKVDFIKKNKNQLDFGKKCEEIIYRHEIDKLTKEGREDLADNIIWVSNEQGDGLGYDIKSFENRNGIYETIYIEVKGTDKNITEPFEITIDEVRASEDYKENYYICRIAKANTEKPEFYMISGEVRKNFKLEALKYEATGRKK